MKSLPLFLSLSLASALPNLRARQLGTSTTENDLTNGSPCKAVTVIFARGTTEAGNVGSLAGPPFFQALANDIGASNLAVQGVDYPASIAGFLAGGDAAGSTTFAGLVQQASTQCPNTKIVMSGYSQGGQLVHNAAKQLSAATSAKVNSVVIFGDPDNGQAVGSIPASKVLIICHQGDNICQGGDEVLEPHLTYSQNAGQAATFVQQHAGL
ncbi:MAG: hypothetical protein MMC23_008997 [Stictis urceolatum]|nr:hypothetical protein [Stictis urceolata]